MTYPIGGHWSVSIVTPPDDDAVLTIDQLKERARLVAGDEESDELYKSYRSAACRKVEKDTGYALAKQTIAVSYDRVEPGTYLVPMPPTQAITSVLYMDVTGGSTVFDDSVIAQLDRVSAPARLIFTSGAFAGLPAALSVQALGLVVEAGFDVDAIPDSFRFLVGLLAAHYVTAGRDLAVLGERMEIMPAGYTDMVNALRLETVV